MKITKDDLYKEGIFRTRGNPDGSDQWPAVIMTMNAADYSPNTALAIVLSDKGDFLIAISANGRYLHNKKGTHRLDIIRIKPYDHIKKYDPVVVWDKKVKYPRLFSHIDVNGLAVVFEGVNGYLSWNNCILLSDYIKENGEL